VTWCAPVKLPGAQLEEINYGMSLIIVYVVAGVILVMSRSNLAV